MPAPEQAGSGCGVEVTSNEPKTHCSIGSKRCMSHTFSFLTEGYICHVEGEACGHIVVVGTVPENIAFFEERKDGCSNFYPA